MSIEGQKQTSVSYAAMSALGLGCAKTRGSRISTEGFQPGGAVGLLSKINEFES